MGNIPRITKAVCDIITRKLGLYHMLTKEIKIKLDLPLLQKVKNQQY